MRLFDFSGFNSVTSETVPKPGDRSDMRNYWETSHYREKVGNAILRRLDGGECAPDGFGDELLPETIGAHIAMLRQRRSRYLPSHAYEAGVARRIADRHVRGL